MGKPVGCMQKHVKMVLLRRGSIGVPEKASDALLLQDVQQGLAYASASHAPGLQQQTGAAMGCLSSP